MSRLEAVLGLALLAVMLVALYLVFIWVPNEKTMGAVQRIWYFHVASAWNALLAFLVVFVGSVQYLRTRLERWDVLAGASAEIGVLFTTLVLITGPIWARAVWGVWWTWDPRLTTTLVLWFIYVAYLVIRATTEGDEKRARFGAVFGIIGFVDVPIVFMSIRWWRSVHPVVFEPGRMGVASSMLATLLVSVGAFTLLYVYLLRHRVVLENLKREISTLKQVLRGD